MSQRIELNKKLQELKKKIIYTAKDAHFTETLVDELITTKGQLCTEPLELNVGKKVDEFKGKTFAIIKTDRGCLYHEYGGYNIFITPAQHCLYTTLVDYVDNKDTYFELTGEEKDVFEMNLSVVAYYLSVPKFCLADVDVTYDIATKVIEFLRKSYEKAMEEPLQEETIEQDEQFKEATLGLENIKEEIKNIEKESKE
jgi:hypothetical protein